MTPEILTTLIAAMSAAIGAGFTKLIEFLNTKKVVEVTEDVAEREWITNERKALIEDLKQQAQELRTEISALREENSKLRERIASLERLVARLHPDEHGTIELSSE